MILLGWVQHVYFLVPLISSVTRQPSVMVSPDLTTLPGLPLPLATSLVPA